MPKSIKNFLVVLVFTFLYCCNSFAGDWKIKNKWKISCGIADKESLVVNGKPKKSYNKKEFKLDRKDRIAEKIIHTIISD